MCSYLNKNNCKATNSICPYIYFCNKTLTWKESKTTPKDCKIKIDAENKKNKGRGYYKVIKERKGKLYINIDNEVCILDNPYKNEECPEFVRVSKNKLGEYYIKK